MKLLISTRGILQKALTKAPQDGAPTVRLHVSGTRVDLTRDKVYDEVLQRWKDQADAGKVMLLENHHAAFPCGRSFAGEIVDLPARAAVDPDTGAAVQMPASRELYIEFWLDTSHPMTPVILSQIGEGYEAQCSVGIVTPHGVAVSEPGYDPTEGKVVGQIRKADLTDLEHVAFTRPNDAAYQYADVDSISLKSLDEAFVMMKPEPAPIRSGMARSILKTYSRSKNKSAAPAAQENPMIKSKYKEAMDAAVKAREEMCAKMKDPAAQKEDMTMAVKAANQHLASLKAMGDEIMGDQEASPDDVRAMLQHVLAESAMVADVLGQYMGEPGAGAAGTESPAEEAAEAAAAEGADKGGPAVPAPAAPVLAESEQKAVASPGAPVAPGAATPPAPAKPAEAPAAPVAHAAPGIEHKDDMGMALKSLTETVNKLTKAREDDAAKMKAMSDALEKFKAIPDLREAPAVSQLDKSLSGPAAAESGSRALQSLNPATRWNTSQQLLTQSLTEAIGAMAADEGESGAVR